MSAAQKHPLLPKLSPAGVAGLLLCISLLLFAVVTVAVGPEPGRQQINDILAGPSPGHPMGTDQLGRDQLARVAAGARNSVVTVLVVVAVSGIGGGMIGLASGYLGGRTDLVLQRAIDALMAMPLIVLVLAVVAAVEASFWSVSLAISVAFSPLSARVARSSAVTLRHAEYVAAAHINGASLLRIIFRHLVPNSAGPWAIVAASQAGAAILVEAALAFLGAAPGRITLGGLMGADAQTHMYDAPWLIIWPGTVLAMLALSVNLLGEWVSDRVSDRPGSG